MGKFAKRLLAFLLVVSMTLGSAETAFASETGNTVSADTGGVEISASESADSFGTMLADVLAEAQTGSDSENNSGSYVGDLTIEGTTASVKLNTVTVGILSLPFIRRMSSRCSAAEQFRWTVPSQM